MVWTWGVRSEYWNRKHRKSTWLRYLEVVEFYFFTVLTIVRLRNLWLNHIDCDRPHFLSMFSNFVQSWIETNQSIRTLNPLTSLEVLASQSWVRCCSVEFYLQASNYVLTRIGRRSLKEFLKGYRVSILYKNYWKWRLLAVSNSDCFKCHSDEWSHQG